METEKFVISNVLNWPKKERDLIHRGCGPHLLLKNKESVNVGLLLLSLSFGPKEAQLAKEEGSRGFVFT